MEQRGNKTIMCSVLFLDIVAYSKKSVTAQIAQKELFNTMLANAISGVPVNDRVILDTGDGAAITFLGDVEDALKAVLAFRESLLGEGANMDPPLLVRMGINLGPVRLIKDINGQPNIVGDGINVAQRIMGFAKSGQILVSRSYFDAASRLSHEYAGMFFSEGSRTDKHVREHEIYAIRLPGDASSEPQSVGEDTLGLAGKQGFASIANEWLHGILSTYQNASIQQRALYAGIAACTLALLIVLTVKITHRSEPPPPQIATETQTTPGVAPAESSVAALTTATSGIKSAAPETASAPTEVAGVTEKNASKAAHRTDTAGQGKEHKQLSGHHTPQDSTSKPTSEAKSDGVANVGLAVAPWGEIYLDGKKQGVSPPLDVLHVTPGMHSVEIRNTTFPPYTLSIQVKAGEQMKIKHKFGN